MYGPLTSFLPALRHQSPYYTITSHNCTAQNCITFLCIALDCIAFLFIELNSTDMPLTALYNFVLHCTPQHCAVSNYTAMRWTPLHSTALFSIKLYSFNDTDKAKKCCFGQFCSLPHYTHNFHPNQFTRISRKFKIELHGFSCFWQTNIKSIFILPDKKLYNPKVLFFSSGDSMSKVWEKRSTSKSGFKKN